jgi:ketosteroid isomerase-like protein
MKKILLTSLALGLTALFIGCGDQGSANKPANAPANTANANKPAAPVDTAAIESDIKKAVSEYAAGMAKNDIAAFDKATADNFMFVGNDGTVSTKAERMDSMKSGATKYESLTYDDLNVRVKPDGEGAIVIGKATVKGMNMGKPIDGANRVTQVWMKTKDGWKMVTLQATAITAKSDDKKTEEKKPDNKMKADNKAADKAPSSPSNK